MVGEGAKVLEALRNVWKERSLTERVKKGLFDGIVPNNVVWM